MVAIADSFQLFVCNGAGTVGEDLVPNPTPQKEVSRLLGTEGMELPKDSVENGRVPGEPLLGGVGVPFLE
ncbi:MAG: hypothetical protein DRH08_14705, partial [Deltaproteobacteria bacterium]